MIIVGLALFTSPVLCYCLDGAPLNPLSLPITRPVTPAVWNQLQTSGRPRWGGHAPPLVQDGSKYRSMSENLIRYFLSFTQEQLYQSLIKLQAICSSASSGSEFSTRPRIYPPQHATLFTECPKISLNNFVDLLCAWANICTDDTDPKRSEWVH